MASASNLDSLPLAVQVQETLVAAQFHFPDGATEEQLDAFPEENRVQDLRRIPILAPEDLFPLFDHRDTAAEPGEGLRQLAADRTGAYYREPPRQFSE